METGKEEEEERGKGKLFERERKRQDKWRERKEEREEERLLKNNIPPLFMRKEDVGKIVRISVQPLG